ncbi:MAG: hypothetical protein AB7D43_03090 [Sulfurimonadaceae bacterium]
MSKLLLDENPLVIIPSLAKKIGLNEAIVIQQIHYWLLSSKKVVDGRRWTYNTFEELEKQFPFWSQKTIKRTIYSLRDLGYIFIENHSADKRDKTNWYSINYDLIEEKQEGESEEIWCPNASGQNDPMEEDKMTQSHRDKMTRCNKVKSLTKNSTKNSTEKKNIKKEFSFSLTQLTQLDNTTQDYQAKLRAYAVTKDGGYSYDNFLNHHLAKGSKFKDWSRAYNTWLQNTQKFNKIDPTKYVRKIEHPTLPNVYAAYDANVAYDADTLTCLGEFRVIEREPTQEEIEEMYRQQAAQQQPQQQRRDVGGLLGNLAQGVRV